jgi:hypothetical protein
MDDNDNFFLNLQKQNENQLQKLMLCNQYTEKFGVRLSENEAGFLLTARKNNLKEQERVEFGEGILPKIIVTFCDSPFIYQDNYVDTLEALQNIFYLYKNESLEELTDDELLEYMKEYFDGVCQGSLEHLEDTCLEQLARRIRKMSHGSIGRYPLRRCEDNFEEEGDYEDE